MLILQARTNNGLCAIETGLKDYVGEIFAVAAEALFLTLVDSQGGIRHGIGVGHGVSAALAIRI
jgi:hypothetical protein